MHEWELPRSWVVHVWGEGAYTWQEARTCGKPRYKVGAAEKLRGISMRARVENGDFDKESG